MPTRKRSRAKPVNGTEHSAPIEKNQLGCRLMNGPCPWEQDLNCIWLLPSIQSVEKRQKVAVHKDQSTNCKLSLFTASTNMHIPTAEGPNVESRSSIEYTIPRSCKDERLPSIDLCMDPHVAPSTSLRNTNLLRACTHPTLQSARTP